MNKQTKVSANGNTTSHLNDVIAMPELVELSDQRTIQITEWSPTIAADGLVTVTVKGFICIKE